MTPDRKPDGTDTSKETENVRINDLPATDDTAAKVKGGAGPIDAKTGTRPLPFGPIDA
jgi:hypothetical protein